MTTDDVAYVLEVTFAGQEIILIMHGGLEVLIVTNGQVRSLGSMTFGSLQSLIINQMHESSLRQVNFDVLFISMSSLVDHLILDSAGRS